MFARRSPHGERGLKWDEKVISVKIQVSLPSRGAWIEMVLATVLAVILDLSLPSRGAWIEIDISRRGCHP